MAWSETAGKLGHRIGDITVALKSDTTDVPQAILSDVGKMHVLPYLWNPNSLAFEVSTGGSTPGANVTVTNFPATQAVSGPLTDTQLRASDVAVIPNLHKRIHEGRFFSTGYYNPTVADTAFIELVVQTHATLATHANVTGMSGGDSTIQVFEGATFSAAGTALVPSNHDRSSAKVFGGTVTHTPTLLTTGTQVNGTIFVPGGGKAGSGGSGEFAAEFVLAPSTTYLFRITNVSGATKKQSILLEAYQPNL